MADYEFTLPYPPSVNGYWRSFQGRQIISKRGREYRESAANAIKLLGLTNELVSQRLSVSVVINPPTLRKYDIDNWCKGPFDALTHAGFWVDDEQVDRLLISKGEKVKGGRVCLKINIIDS